MAQAGEAEENAEPTGRGQKTKTAMPDHPVNTCVRQETLKQKKHEQSPVRRSGWCGEPPIDQPYIQCFALDPSGLNVKTL
ncbi:hypothetical protein BXY39_3740 [Eilatimonas milleporae]|uniref:Uncharacterized protein n=1 Tax=Eilatimonas milleporae TaxID=911205 RepID=A0A3M0BVE6_9PROT|nr:hypothetical protein BXY39_3740 [Eilatimonas milleporae]